MTDSPETTVVSIEPGAGLIVPHIMRREAYYALRHALHHENGGDNAVAMTLGYAEWRHLKAIVVDERLMLQLREFVVVQLRVAQFDDGT